MPDNTQLVTRGQDYGKILLPLARQEKSKLFDKVWVRKDIVGKSFYQDQIGNWEMSAKTGLNVNTPENDLNLARTRIDIATYHDARLMDRSVNLQSFTDPMSQASTCITSSVGIQIDKIIYNALGGTAYRGETGSESVVLPAASIIGDGGEGLTLEKILTAAEKMNAKGVPMEGRTIAINATGLTQLLSDPKLTSADYNNVKALVRGELNYFVGFEFVVIPDGIINVADGVADFYAFQKTGICLGMLEELFLRMSEREDKSYSKQVYYEINGGAGRLEEAKVIKIKAALPTT